MHGFIDFQEIAKIAPHTPTVQTVLLFRYGTPKSDSLIAACQTQDDAAATVPGNRNQRGPYFADFSLPVPDMRSFIDMREIAKNLSCSPRV